MKRYTQRDMTRPLLMLGLLLAFPTACDGSAFEVLDESVVEEDAGHDDSGEGDVPNPCPPPSDPRKAALCLVIEPEEIDFISHDERFDGRGILHLVIFDKARPGKGGALDERTRPPQGNAPVIKPLEELVTEPVRFELAPGTVYPRALFLDDLSAFGAPTLKPGMWLGGFDFEEAGLVEDAPLLPVELEAGRGQEVVLKLSALRQMNISIANAAVPIGNSQGSLLVAAVDRRPLSEQAKVYGLATHPCFNLLTSAKSESLEGVVVGEGPYWLTALLDDFGKGGALPPGALVSFDWETAEISDQDELRIPPGAYRISKTIELRRVVPVTGDVRDQESCRN